MEGSAVQMTKEQAKEIKRIMGILEECKQDMEPIVDSLDKETDEMTDEQQNDNPDLVNLSIEITDATIRMGMVVNSVMGYLELVEGELTE
jgi:hypothetical protein